MLTQTRVELEYIEKKSLSLEQLLVEKDMEIQSTQIRGKQTKLEMRNLKVFCDYQKKKFTERSRY